MTFQKKFVVKLLLLLLLYVLSIDGSGPLEQICVFNYAEERPWRPIECPSNGRKEKVKG